MDKSGRTTNVLIQDDCPCPNDSDKNTLKYWITVYADAGLAETIASVAGVRSCYNNLNPITYSVYLDPRYDRNTVKSNIIEAVTLATTPKPTPALDAEKVGALIDTMFIAAHDWGFHRASAVTAPADSILRNICTSLADREIRKCLDARAELEKMLGIEEG